mmetsp:Transcript_48324/g.105384  ORF Transcript_48324/g.105384 Transcript_48324/m.105384 type:complete len:275 (-) Transcript_48324:34-858(-)
MVFAEPFLHVFSPDATRKSNGTPCGIARWDVWNSRRFHALTSAVVEKGQEIGHGALRHVKDQLQKWKRVDVASLEDRNQKQRLWIHLGQLHQAGCTLLPASTRRWHEEVRGHAAGRNVHLDVPCLVSLAQQLNQSQCLRFSLKQRGDVSALGGVIEVEGKFRPVRKCRDDFLNLIPCRIGFSVLIAPVFGVRSALIALGWIPWISLVRQLKCCHRFQGAASWRLKEVFQRLPGHGHIQPTDAKFHALHWPKKFRQLRPSRRDGSTIGGLGRSSI